MRRVLCYINRLLPDFPDDKIDKIRSVFIPMDRFMFDIVQVYCEHSLCLCATRMNCSSVLTTCVHENCVRRNRDIKCSSCLIKTSVGVATCIQAFLATALDGDVISFMPWSPSPLGKEVPIPVDRKRNKLDSYYGRSGKDRAVFLT
jgi:hypothetical protein